MIVLFTDFGINGPYVGQMQAAIYQVNADAKLINLFVNVPSFNPKAAGYLLSAYVTSFPEGTVFLAVVDPGVGSDQRNPIVATIDGKYFVGPDNGLFDVVALHATHSNKQEILWQPDSLSATFHGRDLFAPIAAHLEHETIHGDWLGEASEFILNEIEADLYELIYIDDYGNAMTGLRANNIPADSIIKINGVSLTQAQTFSDVKQDEPFWYHNSNGLAEIAVNCGSAAKQLSLGIGMPFEIYQVKM